MSILTKYYKKTNSELNFKESKELTQINVVTILACVSVLQVNNKWRCSTGLVLATHSHHFSPTPNCSDTASCYVPTLKFSELREYITWTSVLADLSSQILYILWELFKAVPIRYYFYPMQKHICLELKKVVFIFFKHQHIMF